MSAREQSLSEGYALERQRFIELWQDDNQFEGVSAFLENVPPGGTTRQRGKCSE